MFLYVVLAAATVALTAWPGAASASGSTRDNIGNATQRWKLASDFRIAPDESNPNPDSYGNPRVWAFEQGTTTHDPSTYRRLPEFNPQMCGVEGIEGWQSPVPYPPNNIPLVGINATGADQFACRNNLSWPARVVLMHPFGGEAVIVRWRSPLTGRVRVDVRFSDLDNACGDGVRWYVDKGSTTRASGQIANGGSPQSASLGFQVHTGTSVYFIVDDGPFNDFECDSTGLAVIIHT
jgi:hypothetical protein